MFRIRTTRPTANDKWADLYNNRNNGGLSKCVNGKPMDSQCNVLCNCVGYACGRFNEIYNEVTGYTNMKYPMFNCNAENFIERAKSYGLMVGQIPQPGAILCWQKGGTLSGGDGAGHVCVVEEVYGTSSVNVSESGWNSYLFRNKKRSGANYGCSILYKFRGFIYNPSLYTNPFKIPTDTLKKGMKGEEVMWLQHQLKLYGYDLVIDGSFGGKTDSAVRDFQANNLGVDGKKLTVDGKVGKGTRTALMNNYLKH